MIRKDVKEGLLQMEQAIEGQGLAGAFWGWWRCYSLPEPELHPIKLLPGHMARVLLIHVSEALESLQEFGLRGHGPGLGGLQKERPPVDVLARGRQLSAEAFQLKCCIGRVGVVHGMLDRYLFWGDIQPNVGNFSSAMR